jgi:hypothetical protein
MVNALVAALVMTADPGPCVTLLDADTVSVRQVGDSEVTLELVTRRVTEATRATEATPARRFTREVSAAEVEAVLELVRPLCLRAESLDPGTRSGTVGHFVLTQKNGSTRLLGEAQGVPLGHPPYFVIGSTLSDQLRSRFPVADPSKMPPPVEQALAKFIEQVVSGRPELTRALLQLDPKQTLFEAIETPVPALVKVELRPKKGSGLSVAALARTLGVRTPGAQRVGARWVLADGKAPLTRWKGAQLEVQLSLPGDAPRATLEGATVAAIVVQVPRP